MPLTSCQPLPFLLMYRAAGRVPTSTFPGRANIADISKIGTFRFGALPVVAAVFADEHAGMLRAGVDMLGVVGIHLNTTHLPESQCAVRLLPSSRRAVRSDTSQSGSRDAGHFFRLAAIESSNSFVS